jgi:hypothetical protein
MKSIKLEGLVEFVGKSDGKITFENFTEFLNFLFFKLIPLPCYYTC